MQAKQPLLRKRLVVEGNIGAGKSTFLRIISQLLDAQVIFEPHEKWQEIGGGENLLDKFYHDTVRWAYTFQSYAFITRILETEATSKKSSHAIQILERSVYSDRYCFAKNCFEMGTMNALEWKLYQEWFSWLVDTYAQKPAGFIYLRTDPETCFKRVSKRKRFEEDEISLAYLQLLHQKHEDWLVYKKEVDDSLSDVPVLVLECDRDFEHSVAEQQKLCDTIMQFFAVTPKPGVEIGKKYSATL